MTQQLIVRLEGLSSEEKLERMHQAASELMQSQHLDWARKPELEKEALVWVQMLEWSSTMEEEVLLLRGKILAYIQNHDLLRYHPGRTNWANFNEMIADRVRSRTLSPSQQSDLAFIAEDVMPVVERLGLTNELAPSLSVIRTLVPAIRVAMRRRDDEQVRNLLVQGAAMTVDQAQALFNRPEPQARGMAIATSDTSPIECQISLTREQFSRLRRACSWIDWDFQYRHEQGNDS